jgi:two-component system, NarL family, response regulator LiaR
MNVQKEIKVVIVDDHVLIREAVRSLLSERNGITLVAEGSAGEDVLPLVREHRPDVLLLDIGMPQKGRSMANGSFAVLPALRELQTSFQETKVVILSQYLQPPLLQSIMQYRVNGYLLKSDELTFKLADAVEAVSRGGVYFSPEVSQALADSGTGPDALSEAQRKVLLALAQNPGLGNQELAEELCISINTVKWHLREIYQLLQVNSRTAATVAAIQRNLLPIYSDSYGHLNFGIYGTNDSSQSSTE